MRKYPWLRVLRMAKNGGQSAAFEAGFDAARGEVIATIDADLQNDPEEIPRLLPLLDQHNVDMVTGWRKDRQDTNFRRWQSRQANRIRNWISQDDINDSASSLKVYRAHAVKGLKLFNGAHRFFPILVKMRGYKVLETPVKHSAAVRGDGEVRVPQPGVARVHRPDRRAVDEGAVPAVQRQRGPAAGGGEQGVTIKRLCSIRRRRGFTLTDLAVCLAMAVFLFAVIRPSLARLFERNHQQRCANNLRSLAQWALMYSNAEVRNNTFPRTYWDTTGGSPVTQYTGVNGAESFGPDCQVAPNDVTAGFFLLLKAGEITPEIAVCPGSDAEPWRTSVQDRSNFPSRQYLGYSYACPYGSTNAVNNGWRFNNASGPDYPFAGDMNPGGAALLSTPYTAGRKQMRAVNSPNHGGDGQNVVYCDGHVEFQQTPYCGDMRSSQGYRDHIYTAGVGSGGGVVVKGMPQDKIDAVLLPVIADGFQPPKKSTGLSPLLLGGGIGLLLLVGLGIVLILVLRKKAAPAGVPAVGPPAAAEGLSVAAAGETRGLL